MTNTPNTERNKVQYDPPEQQNKHTSEAYVRKTKDGKYYRYKDQSSGWDIFDKDINKAKIFSPKPTWIDDDSLVEVEIKEKSVEQ